MRDPSARRPGSLLERRLLSHPLTAARAGRTIAVVTVLVSLASAVAITLVDRHDFPSVGSGLWWAVQTVTTVGYGDHVPTRTGGQLVGALVMLTGIGFVTVVTASISAAFVEAARRRRMADEEEARKREFEDLRRQLDRIEQVVQRLAAERG